MNTEQTGGKYCPISADVLDTICKMSFEDPKGALALFKESKDELSVSFPYLVDAVHHSLFFLAHPKEGRLPGRIF